VKHGQHNGFSRPFISVFYTGAATFPFSHEAEWTPFLSNIVKVKVSPITSHKGKGLLPSSRASSVRLMG
jgi:hypothetical protein